MNSLDDEDCQLNYDQFLSRINSKTTITTPTTDRSVYWLFSNDTSQRSTKRNNSNNSQQQNLKFEKKRLINVLNKFKSKVNEFPSQHRKQLNEMKKTLKECSDEFAKKLDDSKTQLDDDLVKSEPEYMASLSKSTS